MTDDRRIRISEYFNDIHDLPKSSGLSFSGNYFTKDMRIDAGELTKLKLIESHRDTRVYKAMWRGRSVAIKAYAIPNMTQAILHELTIGHLLSIIDMEQFVSVFGYIDRGQMKAMTNGECVSRGLVMEYVDGPNIAAWMLKDDICMKVPIIRTVLRQIFLAMQVAYERINFTHYDFYVNNILIRTLDKPKEFTYELLSGDVTIRSKYVPVIIDYGYSYAETKTTDGTYHAVITRGFEHIGIEPTPNPSFDIMRLIRTLAYEKSKGALTNPYRDWMMWLIETLFVINDLNEDLYSALIHANIETRSSGEMKSYHYWPYNIEVSYLEVADFIEEYMK